MPEGLTRELEEEEEEEEEEVEEGTRLIGRPTIR
jgi:hypothetical protein